MLKDNLIMLRNLKGYSQEEIAEMIGISRQAYAKWECGSTIPDVNKCAKLASVYGTTIDTLMNFAIQNEGIVVPPAPKGKHIFGSLTVNERGQIVIPKAARDILQIEPGTRLILLGDEEEGGLALIKADIFEKHIQQTFDAAEKKI